MNIASLHHLQSLLSHIDDLLRIAVMRVEQSGGAPSETLRGLVVSWDEVESTLEREPLAALWEPDGVLDLSLDLAQDTPPDTPFVRLVSAFDLTTLDTFILLACLAPELDRRYERLYAFLQDDMSTKRPTLNLLMSLLGGTLEQRFAVWGRLQPSAPLLQQQLIMPAANPERPNAAGLTDALQVDNRIVRYLLGDPHPDERVRAAIVTQTEDDALPLDEATYTHLLESLPAAPMIYMKGQPNLGQASAAAALCEAHDMALVNVDGARLTTLDTPRAWRLALREGYLNDAALMIENWGALLGENTQPERDFWEALYAYPRPVFLCGDKDWEPLDMHRSRRMLRVTLEIPPYPERLAAWETFTQAYEIDLPPDVLAELSNKFRLSRGGIQRAINTALDMAASRRDAVAPDDLYSGVQSHISLQLGHLAERIHPRYTWGDLILPDDQLRQLHEIADRARFAHQVHNQWGFSRRIPNANGVSALFAGESGTGKTLAVQVIANELGLALYRIDLSAVVSKYIGETEKNLSTIFSEARSSNAILFFDEADALFGKRSEVKDARDRYANIEIAYLLQQIEDYDGVAIMATNLRQNLDEAFTRRLDFLIDFPFPDENYREKIWAAHFPPEAPLDPNVDMRALAERYHLAGGNIRNAALASAYLAAADGGVITTQHVQNAVRREHQKMGRLVTEL